MLAFLIANYMPRSGCLSDECLRNFFIAAFIAGMIRGVLDKMKEK